MTAAKNTSEPSSLRGANCEARDAETVSEEWLRGKCGTSVNRPGDYAQQGD